MKDVLTLHQLSLEPRSPTHLPCPQTLSSTHNTFTLYSSTPTNPTRCMIELTIFSSNCCKVLVKQCKALVKQIKTQFYAQRFSAKFTSIQQRLIDKSVPYFVHNLMSFPELIFIRCSVFLEIVLDWKNRTAQWTV